MGEDAADKLFQELKPDVDAICMALFEMSETLLKKHGDFLPHGAVLPESGPLRLHMASSSTSRDLTNSVEVLPGLHSGIRASAQQQSLKAIGVAESVTITPDGKTPTRAMKVLMEHRRGLTLAL